mgnify:CR=1 FL=1
MRALIASDPGIFESLQKYYKYVLTYECRHCIIIRHEFSVEVECGYKLVETNLEGTSMEYVLA